MSTQAIAHKSDQMDHTLLHQRVGGTTQDLNETATCTTYAVELNQAPIRWGPNRGRLSFVERPAALFWLEPSLLNLLQPLAQVVDTQVANALIRAARAARLLGAQVILTGIKPRIAQTLVQPGADLNGIITHSNLKSGIAFALGQLA